MTRFESIQTDPPRDIMALPNTPIRPIRVPRDAVESPPSTEPKLHDPVGRTVSTSQSDDDEYSDENIREWIEEDKLENQDPRLVEWLVAQLGE